MKEGGGMELEFGLSRRGGREGMKGKGMESTCICVRTRVTELEVGVAGGVHDGTDTDRLAPLRGRIASRLLSGGEALGRQATLHGSHRRPRMCRGNLG